MPRQPRRVYGKRTRAIYDPTAAVGRIFCESPESTSTVKAGIGSNNESKPQSKNKSQASVGVHKRTALGKRDGNTVKKPCLVVNEKCESSTDQDTRRSIRADTVSHSGGSRPSRTRQPALAALSSPARSTAPLGHSVTARNLTSRAQHAACTRGRSISLGSPKSADPHRFIRSAAVERADDNETVPEHVRGLDGTHEIRSDLHPLSEPEVETKETDVHVADETNSGVLESASRSISHHQDAHLQRQTIAPTAPAITILPPNPTWSSMLEDHCAPLLQLSNHNISTYEEWSEQIGEHFNITKIAEASFGEVYRLSLREQIPQLSRNDESVFKVIPLKPPEELLPKEARKRTVALRRAEAMSSPEDVASEIKLLQRMTSVPGFTNFRDVRVLCGRPPNALIDAYKSYNTHQKAQRKDLSIFPDPAKQSSYSKDQLWAVIEMQDAGTDLERYVESGACHTVWSVWDVFWQVVLSMAKGEEEAEFEHRDLHLGNICVRDPDHSARSRKLHQQTIDPKRKFGFTQVETTIIDYTISRCILSSVLTSAQSSLLASESEIDPEIEHAVAYTDLDLPSHASLFTGDSGDEYQYDIYRYMRSTLHLSQPLANFTSLSSTWRRTSQPKSWKHFCPLTNLVWLHFVLYKLLEQVEWPSAEKQPNRKTKRHQHAVWKRANDLEHILLRVQSLLEPAVLGTDDDLLSASNLVALALTEGWLDARDVVGTTQDSELVGSASADDGLALSFEALRVDDGV